MLFVTIKELKDIPGIDQLILPWVANGFLTSEGVSISLKLFPGL